MVLRIQGFAYYLSIPLGIYFLLYQPLGPVGLLIGIGILATHRFVAEPFVEKRRKIRCIWSGAEIAPGCAYRVDAGGKTWELHAYNDRRREKAARTFTTTQTLYWPLRILVFGSLGFFCVAEAARHFGHGFTSAGMNHHILTGALALAALATAVARRFVEPIPHMKGPVRFPFGVHQVALLGIFWTHLLWCVAGAFWIAAIVRDLA